MNINNYIQDSIDTKITILNGENIIETIKKIADRIVEAYRLDKKVLTAISNDFCYEKSFSRQIQAFANEGDVYGL